MTYVFLIVLLAIGVVGVVIVAKDIPSQTLNEVPPVEILSIPPNPTNIQQHRQIFAKEPERLHIKREFYDTNYSRGLAIRF